jgi:hypothetical protein
MWLPNAAPPVSTLSLLLGLIRLCRAPNSQNFFPNGPHDEMPSLTVNGHRSPWSAREMRFSPAIAGGEGAEPAAGARRVVLVGKRDASFAGVEDNNIPRDSGQSRQA